MIMVIASMGTERIAPGIPTSNIFDLDTYACPYTHRKFSTGVETTVESLRVLWKSRLEVNCPHCHKTHAISVREADLEGALRDAASRPGI
jgi:hypothetical protein